MFPNIIRASAFALLALTATSAIAAPPPQKETTSGLKAELVANKDSYTLNPAQSGATFRDSLAKLRGKAPETPAVDLTLKITNTSDKPVTLNVGGDATQILLKLAGPGAASVQSNGPMTMEFRMGNPTTVAPGKSIEMKITNLSYGMRGISQAAYWTEPGDYTLAAGFQQSNEDNTLTKVMSDPVKIKITK